MILAGDLAMLPVFLPPEGRGFGFRFGHDDIESYNLCSVEDTSRWCWRKEKSAHREWIEHQTSSRRGWGGEALVAHVACPSRAL